MKINWAKSKKNIPTKLRIAKRKFFDILWIDSLFDTVGNKLFGKTDFEKNQIILNKDQSDKETVETVWHEFCHALDHDDEMGLTEAQVVKLEEAYPFIREFVLTLEGKNEKKK